MLPRGVYDLFFQVEELTQEALIGNSDCPVMLMQLLWKDQNSCIFGNIERSMARLELLLIQTLFDWFRVWGLTSSISLRFYKINSLLCIILL